MLHDCFGAILLVEDGAVKLLCGECGKEYGRLDKDGLHVVSKHGSHKHENVVALKALKIAVERVEKSG